MDSVASFMLSGECKRIAVLIGAGISVGAGECADKGLCV